MSQDPYQAARSELAAAAENVRDSARALRAHSGDAALCRQIEATADEVLAVAGRAALSPQRLQVAVQLLRYLQDRIGALIAAGAAAAKARPEQTGSAAEAAPSNIDVAAETPPRNAAQPGVAPAPFGQVAAPSPLVGDATPGRPRAAERPLTTLAPIEFQFEASPATGAATSQDTPLDLPVTAAALPPADLPRADAPPVPTTTASTTTAPAQTVTPAPAPPTPLATPARDTTEPPHPGHPQVRPGAIDRTTNDPLAPVMALSDEERIALFS